MSDRDDSTPEFVELIRVGSAKEAAEIVEMLRRADVAAIPHLAGSWCCVRVPSDSVEVAEAVVDAIYFRPEGDVSHAEIEAELSDHLEARDHHRAFEKPDDEDVPQPLLTPRSALLLVLLLLLAFLTLAGL